MLDIERAFVVGCTHDERTFAEGAVGSAVRRRGPVMTVLELYPPVTRDFVAKRPELRLVEGAGSGPWDPEAVGPTRRRVPVEVRRRRTLLALMGLLLGALALPLGGAGGHSHAPGSASAGTGHPVAYVVRPGDTLWTIAERVDPTADPRPMVAQLAAQLGSDTVVPGERVTLP
jgi:nucleoid-associated protein YgaU